MYLQAKLAPKLTNDSLGSQCILPVSLLQEDQCIQRCEGVFVLLPVWVNHGCDYLIKTRKRKTDGSNLLPIATIFSHHFPQRLQHFDAQTFLILLQ